MDIRLCTVLIIRRDKQYLVGMDINGRLRWSNSPYDAWSTRIRANAKSIREKTGGDILLFNPVAGAMKEFGRQ